MRRLIEIVLLSVLFPIAAQGRDKAAEELVRQYVQARSQTMQEQSNSRDIERALSFCAESFVYEHPSAGARIEGKERVRSGMSGYLGQTKSTTYALRILASNPDVVVAQVDQRFLAKQEDGSWKPGNRSNITVFEIEGGKIRRILDY
jgi:ketosteroid isomerase-like protein